MTLVVRLVFSVSLLSLTSCKSSVSVQGSESPSELTPVISSPSVVVPENQHYYSNESTLTIAGLCKDGRRVRLAGADVQEVVCVDNGFSFSVEQTTDGDYSFFVSQTDGLSESRPITVLWSRVTSVAPPSLIAPTTDPYKSSSLNITIDGNCQSGNTIILRQDGVGSTDCVNSNFSLSFPKFADGDYTIEIVQQDPAGNESSISFVWEKRDIVVAPANPQIIAATAQAISVTGGSEVYAFTLTANSSGSVFDDMTQTYTAGTIAGGFDLLEITDSEGAVETMSIAVIAAAADHFEFPVDSGTGIVAEVNEAYTAPLKVQVVDRYNNPVSSFQAIFRIAVEGLGFTTSLLQNTDTTGNITLPIFQGNTALQHRVSVQPVGAALPDLAGSGRDVVSLSVRGSAQNTGSFGLEFSLGTSPDEVISGDFDGDTINDFLVLNEADPSVSFLKGAGTGLYASQVKDTSVCASPTSMVAGDFDGDTIDDVVIVCVSPDTYEFKKGNGDGTFQAAVSTAADGAENFFTSVAAADFNGDTHLDLAIVSAGANRIGVRFGAGDGTFGAPALYTTGSAPNSLLAVDVDQANRIDLAYVIGGGDSVGWILNNGSGGFGAESSQSSGAGPSDLAAIDFNNDTYVDLVAVCNVDNNVHVFLNDQAGGYNLGIVTPVGNGPISAHAQNLDFDGQADLLVTNASDNTVSVLRGAGNGTFLSDPVINIVSNPINVSSTDTNGDSIQDVVIVANGSSKLFVIPGSPNGSLGYETVVGSNPSAMALSDFNGDGFLDQAVVNRGDNDVDILLGNGRGFFTGTGITPLSTASGANNIHVVDIDRDGIEDVFVSQQDANSVRFFKGTGGVTFATPVDLPTGSQPSAVKSGDFNADGNLDIVATASGVSRFNFFPGNGDGTFGTRTDNNTGTQPSSIAVGDVNDDGHPDVLVTNQSGNTVGIFLSNGDGTFQPESTLATAAGSNGVAVAFLNADPIPDIVVSNETAGSVIVFLGQGNGAFGSPVSYSAGTNVTSLKLSDLNNDTYPDIVVGNGVSSTVTVLFGSAFADYSVSQTLNTATNTLGVELGDVNNDKKVDILFLDGTAAKTKVILGR